MMFQHRKTGGLYTLLMLGVNEADLSATAIYQDGAGTVWVRPASEFFDGRFAPVVPEARKPVPVQ